MVKTVYRLKCTCISCNNNFPLFQGFKNHGEALLHCLILRTNTLGGKEILEPVRQKLANLSCGQLREDLDSIEVQDKVKEKKTNTING